MPIDVSEPLFFLSSPVACVVVPSTGVAELDSVASLMARFTDGPNHADRRRIVVEALGRLDPAELRADAARRTAEAVTSDRDPDLTDVSRRVILAVLASSMGFASVDAVVEAMLVFAGALAPRADRSPVAGVLVREAVAVVAELAPASEPVPQANQIAALFQAVDATAGLVTNALLRAAAVSSETSEIEGLLDVTLAQDPPVRHTRRLVTERLDHNGVSIDAGETVIVPLTAGGFAFGAGPHECPGQCAARAIAAGIVESVLAAGGVSGAALVYEDRWNLRIVDQQRLRQPTRPAG